MSLFHLKAHADQMPNSTSPYLTPPPTQPHTRCTTDVPQSTTTSRRPSDAYPDLLPSSPPITATTTRHPPRPSVFRLPSLSLKRLGHPHTRSGEGDDGGQGEAVSPNGRGDKRRRTSKSGRLSGVGLGHNGDSILPSPSKTHHSYSSISPTSPHQYGSGRFPGLAPIKPIGFAASRGSRREDGSDLAIPSPVVMGFDFKSIDDEQLKTVGPITAADDDDGDKKPSISTEKNQAEALRHQVRDTISIKEQQQALIAQRRRDTAASTPSTPKELTFKGWVPKEPGSAERHHQYPAPPPLHQHPHPAQGFQQPLGSSGVGRRREKIKDKVKGMSIVTSASDKDVMPGSKVSRAYFQRSDRVPSDGTIRRRVRRSIRVSLDGNRPRASPTLRPRPQSHILCPFSSLTTLNSVRPRPAMLAGRETTTSLPVNNRARRHSGASTLAKVTSDTIMFLRPPDQVSTSHPIIALPTLPHRVYTHPRILETNSLILCGGNSEMEVTTPAHFRQSSKAKVKLP